MAQASFIDMIDLINEIERGAKDKTRTLNSISNTIVKDILVKEASTALKAGVTASVFGAGVATALGGAAGAAGAGAGVATALGGAAGAAAGAGAGVATALGGAAGVAGGAAAGAAAGSVVPVVGTIIGGAIGAAATVFVVKRKNKKELKKREILHQEVLKKQNTYIRDLEIELNELKEKYREKVEQNERYKYIISLLMANEELKVLGRRILLF